MFWGSVPRSVSFGVCFCFSPKPLPHPYLPTVPFWSPGAGTLEVKPLTSDSLCKASDAQLSGYGACETDGGPLKAPPGRPSNQADRGIKIVPTVR